MDKTEEIIILVKRNPILYDKTESNYKDTPKRQDVWKELGQKVGLTGKEVESRWRTVRDNYARYRRKLKCRSGDAASTVKEYKYAQVLSFLIPHFAERPTSSNLAQELHDDQLQSDNFTDQDDDASQAADLQWHQNRLATPKKTSIASSSHSKRKRKRSPGDVNAMFCEYLKKKSNSPVETKEKADDVDLFLQSMAGAIRKLPAHKRADVKFKIHSIVHEAEMQCSFPAAMTPCHMTSTSAQDLNLTTTHLIPSLAPHMQSMGSHPTECSQIKTEFLSS